MKYCLVNHTLKHKKKKDPFSLWDLLVFLNSANFAQSGVLSWQSKRLPSLYSFFFKTGYKEKRSSGTVGSACFFKKPKLNVLHSQGY